MIGNKANKFPVLYALLFVGKKANLFPVLYGLPFIGNTATPFPVLYALQFIGNKANPFRWTTVFLGGNKADPFPILYSGSTMVHHHVPRLTVNTLKGPPLPIRCAEFHLGITDFNRHPPIPCLIMFHRFHHFGP